MEIRRFEKSDILDIVRLEEVCLGKSLGEDYFLNMYDNEMFCALVVTAFNNLVGYVSAIFDGDVIEIVNICVSKDFRNKGCATSLLNHYISTYIASNPTHMFLEVNEVNQTAISFYLKYGFKVINIRKKYYNNKDNALVMQYNITNYFDIETSYLDLFTCTRKHLNIIEYYDDIQPDKFMHNFYFIPTLDKDIILKLYKEGKNKDFIQIVSKENNTSLFDFATYVCEEYILMHSVYEDYIDDLIDTSNCCLLVGDCDNLYSFLYEMSYEYGKAYAKNNVSRYIDLYKSGKIKYFVYKKDGVIIASIHVYEYKDSIKLEEFVVNKAYRKQGIGKSLISFVYNFYKTKDKKQIFLVADPLDYPYYWYIKKGFNLGPRFYVYRFLEKIEKGE